MDVATVIEEVEHSPNHRAEEGGAEIRGYEGVLVGIMKWRGAEKRVRGTERRGRGEGEKQ